VAETAGTHLPALSRIVRKSGSVVNAAPIRHTLLRNMHLVVVLALQPLHVVIARPRLSGNLIAVHHRERLK
jgi:hypothetical protein